MTVTLTMKMASMNQATQIGRLRTAPVASSEARTRHPQASQRRTGS